MTVDSSYPSFYLIPSLSQAHTLSPFFFFFPLPKSLFDLFPVQLITLGFSCWFHTTAARANWRGELESHLYILDCLHLRRIKETAWLSFLSGAWRNHTPSTPPHPTPPHHPQHTVFFFFLTQYAQRASLQTKQPVCDHRQLNG